MKATELIAQLQAGVAKNGDGPILLAFDDDSWREAKAFYFHRACQDEDGWWPAPADGTAPEQAGFCID